MAWSGGGQVTSDGVNAPAISQGVGRGDGPAGSATALVRDALNDKQTTGPQLPNVHDVYSVSTAGDSEQHRANEQNHDDSRHTSRRIFLKQKKKIIVFSDHIISMAQKGESNER